MDQSNPLESPENPLKNPKNEKVRNMLYGVSMERYDSGEKENFVFKISPRMVQPRVVPMCAI